MLVTSFNAVYRISEREYRKQLEAVAAGDGYNLAGTCLGEIVMDFTNLTPDEAKFELYELTRRKKKAA